MPNRAYLAYMFDKKSSERGHSSFIVESLTT